MKSPTTPCRDFAAATRGNAISAGTVYLRLSCCALSPGSSYPPRGYSSSPQLWVRCVTLGRRPGPHRFPVGAFDLLPAVLDQFDDAFRHWNVVELFGQLATVVIGPVKEIQRFARDIGFGLLLVHQNEGGPGY